MARIASVPAPSDAPHRHGSLARAGTSRRSASTAAATALTAAALALSMSACAQLLGIDELSPGDAGPSSYRIRGTASGLDEPVSLRLEHSDGDELLTVTQDGPFAFATDLATGAAYAVLLVGDPPCVLGNASGNAGTTPDVELACGPVLLSELALAGVGLPAIDFDPARSIYDIDVSLLQQSVQVSATAASPIATVTVAGEPVAGGEASKPLPLNLGDNAIDVVVRADDAERTYRLNLRRGATVAQHAYAKASNTGAGDELGYSLALSGDTFAVGAPYEDSPSSGVDGEQGDGLSDSGAVYVFRREGDVWKQEAYLKASNPGAGDEFGHSLELAGDLLVVAAPYEDSSGRGVNGISDENATDSGAAYVFRRSGATWAPEVYLKASNTGAGDNFGWSVSLDGDTAVVGAPLEDSGATGVNGAEDNDDVSDAGAVYVFRYSDRWQQEAYLKASNTGREDHFGRNLSMDGDTLAASARFEDSSSRGVNGNQENDAAVNSGAVYVFRRSGTTWDQEAYLKASNTAFEDNFGLSLALDGDTLAVSAPFEDSGATGANGNQDNDSVGASGAVYVFRRNGATWAQEAYIKASNTGEDDNFGWSVDLAGDLLAISAIGESSAAEGPNSNQGDNTANESGAVYLFHRNGATWTQQVYLKASNTEVADEFGYGVALSEDTLVATARYEDGASQGLDGDQNDERAGNSGALYILH